jgi:hypothetical protein
MPSEPTFRPRVERGSLLVYESNEPNAALSKRIDFTYNPEQLRRTVATRTPQPQGAPRGGAAQDVLRVAGPPVETITLAIVLDAADQLAEPAGNDAVVQNGLHPALATLELLLYPSTARVSEIERQAAEGAVQVSEASTPLVLLGWGRSRVVPVQIVSMSVTEEQFDPDLNPIRARVELGLRVLTYIEFPQDTGARRAFIAHQQKKEELSRLVAGGAR